jgi:hypothetical protein
MLTVIARLLPVLTAVLVLVGCGSMEREKKANALEAAVTRYGAAIRWGYDDVAYGFVHPDKRTAKHAGPDNIRVTGYEVVQPPRQTDEKNAEQVVIIDYLHEDVQRVRSLTDRQQWRYEPATGTWWLYSGIPRFK